MPADNYKDHLYALIVAGGGGTRMWPKSREATPKQFLKLFDDKTLMQITSERLHNFLGWERIFVITVSEKYKSEILKEVPGILSENVIVEPQRKDSAPAHGLGALFLYEKDKDAVVINSAADHLLSPITEYIDTIKVAAEVAYIGDWLVAVGIEPLYPHTGMGHIKRGKRFRMIQDRVVYKLDSFTEKPKLSLARIFTRSSKYYWNANQYVWRADSILRALETHSPEIYSCLQKISAKLGTDEEKEVIAEEYKKMPKVSIDYAISEKARNFLLVVAKYNWTDVGDWNEVWKNLPKDKNGNVILEGKKTGEKIINIDTSNALIQTGDRLIAIVDVDDVVIIDTKDALLVCKKSQAQNVKKIVEQLKAEGEKTLL